jgi:hypothetical protein
VGGTTTGEIGVWFIVGSADLTVTRLGRFCHSTVPAGINTTIRLLQTSSLTQLGTVTTQTVPGGWCWGTLATPIVLAAGTLCFIRYDRANIAANWLTAGDPFTVSPAIAGSGPSSQQNQQTGTSATQRMFGPVDMEFSYETTPSGGGGLSEPLTLTQNMTAMSGITMSGSASTLTMGNNVIMGSGSSAWVDIQNAPNQIRMRILNTGASTGALFQNQAADVVDFAFRPSSGTANEWGLRTEARVVNRQDARNTSEMQVRRDASEFNFVVGNVVHRTIRPINFVTATNATPANGDLWFDGSNFRIQIGGVTRTISFT